MGKTLDRAKLQARYICDQAPLVDQRTGQLLFNTLRFEIAEKVRQTELDTFYKDLEFYEVKKWLEDHILFNDEGTMIALFDGNDFLWEE